MKNKFILVVFLFLAFAISFSFLKPVAIFADESATTTEKSLLESENVEVPLGEKFILKDGTPVKEVFNSTDDMINLIVKVVFVGAGIVLFFMIVISGFGMISGGSKDKDKSKTTMTSAAIGFVIMFAAYWIMQIIQLLTGINMGF